MRRIVHAIRIGMVRVTKTGLVIETGTGAATNEVIPKTRKGTEIVIERRKRTSPIEIVIVIESARKIVNVKKNANVKRIVSVKKSASENVSAIGNAIESEIVKGIATGIEIETAVVIEKE